MHMLMFNEFGAPVICDNGCLQICDECHAELAGDATKAYIGSGEDAPVSYSKANGKHTITAL